MELERVDQKMGENAGIQSTTQENILKNHETFDSDDGNSSDGSSVHSNGEVRLKFSLPISSCAALKPSVVGHQPDNN
jgi:hypothetical protein